jgi:hypothetical protein
VPARPEPPRERRIFCGHCPPSGCHRKHRLCGGFTIDFAAARDAVGEEPIAAGGRRTLMNGKKQKAKK